MGAASSTDGSGTGISGVLRRIYVAPAELERRKIKMDIWRSVVALAIATMFSFACYDTLTMLHLHYQRNLATLALAIIVGVTALSGTFLPVFVVRKTGHRALIAGCMVFVVVYFGTQFYPMYYTSVPIAVLMGIHGALFWSAASAYLTRIGEKFAELNSESREVCITRFFGTFYAFFQISRSVGYLTVAQGFPINSTVGMSDGVPVTPCGFRYCAYTATHPQYSGPAFGTSWVILTGVAIGLTLIGAFIAARSLSPLDTMVGDWRGDSGGPPSVGQEILEPLRQCAQPYQLLLLPLTLWAGAQQAFALHVFSQGFAGCSVGINMAAYVDLTFALASAMFSVVSSLLVQQLGRRSIFLSAGFINLSMILLMISWVPLSSHLPLFFIVAIIWGLGDAVWNTLLSALYGVLFPLSAEAVFSCLVLWRAAGYLTVFLTFSLLCVDATVYILLMLLFSGIIGYLCVEIVEGRRYGEKDASDMQQLQ